MCTKNNPKCWLRFDLHLRIYCAASHCTRHGPMQCGTICLTHLPYSQLTLTFCSYRILIIFNEWVRRWWHHSSEYMYIVQCGLIKKKIETLPLHGTAMRFCNGWKSTWWQSHFQFKTLREEKQTVLIRSVRRKYACVLCRLFLNWSAKLNIDPLSPKPKLDIWWKKILESLFDFTHDSILLKPTSWYMCARECP